jgi:hypothetical protein
LEKRKGKQKKTGERLRRSELLGSSVSCAQLLHARKVFWKGSRETFFSKKVFPCGGELFSKSFSPIKESGKPFQKVLSFK